MNTATSITFRNWRSIGPNGARLDLTKDFTAVVGVNNAGKTSVIRVLYELRPIVHRLAHLETGDSQLLACLKDGFDHSLAISAGERYRPLHHLDATPRIEVTLDIEPTPDARTIAQLNLVNPTGNIWQVEFVDDNGTVFTRPTQASSVTAKSVKSVVQIQTETGSIAVHWDAIRSALQDLVDTMYIGAFRNSINSGGGSYYDLGIGRDFIARFENAKSGPDPVINEAIEKMSRELAEIFGFSYLNIHVSPEKDHLIYVTNTGSQRASELGAGITQFIIVASSVLMRRPTFLLIDEPELNLHASLQQRFLTLLGSYTTRGVVFSTHSLGLARTADTTLVCQRNEHDLTVVHEYASAPNLSTALGELGYGGLHDTSYKVVLLVEGSTEVRSMQQWLTKYGVSNEVAIVSLGGTNYIGGGRDLELAEIRKLCRHVFAIIDSERTAADTPVGTGHAQFALDCAKQGIECLTLERRAFENYLNLDVARRLRSMGTVPNFGPYDALPQGWRKQLNWRIVQESPAEQFAGTDLGDFLARIVDLAKST